MHILVLSDSDSPHTIRWVNSLLEAGFSITLFTIHTPDKLLYKILNLDIHSLNVPRTNQNRSETDLYKLTYLRSLFLIKKIIKGVKPDILHAHFASSYGILGALTGFHPYIISVWGSDIYNFPEHSMIHRAIIKFNLLRADKILSTSNTMKKRIKQFTSKEIEVTPFGIDTKKFIPEKIEKKVFSSGDLVIGTIKTLEEKYGIEYLIRAFYHVKKRFPNLPLKLLIVGKGSLENKLKYLVSDLKLDNDTYFTGYINPDEISEYHKSIDIFVSVSVEDSESFGVAVLESSSCGKPVIVSNVGGLKEVVENGKTGLIVEKRNPEALAEAMEKIIMNPALGLKLGKNGRKKVEIEYEWSNSVDNMIRIYKSLISN